MLAMRNRQRSFFFLIVYTVELFFQVTNNKHDMPFINSKYDL